MGGGDIDLKQQPLRRTSTHTHTHARTRTQGVQAIFDVNCRNVIHDESVVHREGVCVCVCVLAPGVSAGPLRGCVVRACTRAPHRILPGGGGGVGGFEGGFKCTTVVRLLPHPVSVNKGRGVWALDGGRWGEDHTRAHARAPIWWHFREARGVTDAEPNIVIAVKLAVAFQMRGYLHTHTHTYTHTRAPLPCSLLRTHAHRVRVYYARTHIPKSPLFVSRR